MRLLIKHQNKRGLVPVKKRVHKNGKTFMQTFYVKPDQAVDNMKPASAPAWQGPLGDDRAYITVGKTGEEEAIRIPEDAIMKRINYEGYNLIVHPAFDSIHRQFVDDRTDVTEATTGRRVARVDGMDSKKALEEAERVLDEHADKMPSIMAKVVKVADIPSENFTENSKFVHHVKTSEEDYKKIAEHIYENVLDQGPIDDENNIYHGEVNDIVEWLYSYGDLEYRDADLQAEMDKFNPDEQLEMEIALQGNMSLDDARDTAQALSLIADTVDEYVGGGYEFVNVMDWWKAIGKPSLNSKNIPMSDSNAILGIEITQGEVLSQMVDNDWTFDVAKDWAADYMEELEEQEQISDIDDDVSLQDRNGQTWIGPDLNTVGDWVHGTTVEGERALCRNSDDARRGGMPPSVHGDMESAVESHMMEYPGKELYRRTPNGKWIKAEVGTTIPLGIASFTTSKTGLYSGSKVVLVMRHGNEGTSESSKIEGLNINELGEDVAAAGYNAHRILEYNTEKEFVVRSPSVRIVARYPPGDDNPFGIKFGTTVVVVEPAEMDLLKSLQNAFSPLIEELYETFNEPLSERQPILGFSDWVAKKMADATDTES